MYNVIPMYFPITTSVHSTLIGGVEEGPGFAEGDAG